MANEVIVYGTSALKYAKSLGLKEAADVTEKSRRWFALRRPETANNANTAIDRRVRERKRAKSQRAS